MHMTFKELYSKFASWDKETLDKEIAARRDKISRMVTIANLDELIDELNVLVYCRQEKEDAAK